MKIDNKCYIINMVLTIILIVFFTSAPTYLVANYPLKFYVCAFILLNCGTFFLMLFSNSYKFDIRYMICLVVYVSVILIFLLFRANGRITSFAILLWGFPYAMFLCAYLYRNNYYEFFLRKFCIIGTIVAGISIFFWLFGSILHIITPSGNISLNWGGQNIDNVRNYYNIYIEPQGYDFNLLGLHIGRRNCSFYAEAPMACFVFVNTLLIMEFFVKEKLVKNKILLIIAILTTLTTSGYIFLMLYFLYKIIKIKTTDRFNMIIKMLIIMFALMLILLGALCLFSVKQGTVSGQVRSYKLFNEFKAFLGNPFIGQGFNEYTKGSSNSFMALLADGGIVLWGIYYLAPIIGTFKSIIWPNKKVFFYILFMIVFFNISIQYYLFTVLIVVIQWIEILKKDRMSLIYAK